MSVLELTACKRLLLDTNVVVNAAFIPNSFSDYCVRLALESGYQLFVSDLIEVEIANILMKAANTGELRTRAEERVASFLSQVLTGRIVVENHVSVPSKVPRNDEHVYRGAIQSDLAVLTGDAALWLALRETGISSLLPLEFIRKLNGMAISNTIFGVMPKTDSGLLFVRAYPGNWVSGQGVGRFTLLHTASGIWLYFDNKKGCWIAEVAGLKDPLCVAAKLEDRKLSTVALSWGTSNKKRLIKLLADSSEPCEVPLSTDWKLTDSPQYRLGATLNGRDCWSRTIYHCVSDDRPIGKDTWKKFLQHRDLAPNPYDADRLSYVVNHPR